MTVSDDDGITIEMDDTAFKEEAPKGFMNWVKSKMFNVLTRPPLLSKKTKFILFFVGPMVVGFTACVTGVSLLFKSNNNKGMTDAGYALVATTCLSASVVIGKILSLFCIPTINNLKNKCIQWLAKDNPYTKGQGELLNIVEEIRKGDGLRQRKDILNTDFDIPLDTPLLPKLPMVLFIIPEALLLIDCLDYQSIHASVIEKGKPIPDSILAKWLTNEAMEDLGLCAAKKSLNTHISFESQREKLYHIVDYLMSGDIVGLTVKETKAIDDIVIAFAKKKAPSIIDNDAFLLPRTNEIDKAKLFCHQIIAAAFIQHQEAFEKRDYVNDKLALDSRNHLKIKELNRDVQYNICRFLSREDLLNVRLVSKPKSGLPKEGEFEKKFESWEKEAGEKATSWTGFIKAAKEKNKELVLN